MTTSTPPDIADVLIVGAGPVGLTLALDLARHGIRPRIVDRLPAPSPYCRAIGVTPRTLEVWDDLGVARDAIDAGIWIEGTRQVAVGGPTADVARDFSDLPYGSLGLPQYETERVLTQHLARAGVRIERGVQFDGLVQAGETAREGDAVRATLADAAGKREEASFRYVVGCDGARSAVRKAVGIAFEGETIPAEFMLGDVTVAWDLPRGRTFFAIRPNPGGVPDFFVAIPLPEPGRYRVSAVSRADLPADTRPAAGAEHGIQSERPGPALAELQAVADRLVPGGATLGDLRWSSLFRIGARLAAAYRRGNVFLAGDAAHIHPPTGGLGMNTGIQDAYNLAWKLSLALRGRAADGLLDSYEAERRPVGADVVAGTTRASVNLGRDAGPKDRLADTQLLVTYRGSRRVANETTGPTDADAAGGAAGRLGPAAGDRVPDCGGLRRRGVGHPIRLFDVLRGPEHVLVLFVPTPADAVTVLPDLSAFLNRHAGDRQVCPVVIFGAPSVPPDVVGTAGYADAGGEFRRTFGPGPLALLVRPDGYLAWRGTEWQDAGLVDQLARVFR